MPSPNRTALLFTVVGLAAGGAVYTVLTAGNSGDPNFNGCGRLKGTAITDCPYEPPDNLP
jgi:hypothetical protein